MATISDQQRLRNYFPHCGWPHLYYGVVAYLGQTIQAKTIVEIGVAYGYHAHNILTALPHCQYHGVDPYQAGYDATDPFGHDVAILFDEQTSEQQALDRLYEAVRGNLVAFGDRAALHRLPSVKGSALFADESTDLIFIDGDHRYEPVKNDLSAWWPKLRNGGIFCGDDYLWPDVKRAVDDFGIGLGRKVDLVAKPNVSYPIWVIKK